MTKRKGVRLNADILIDEMDILDLYSKQIARSKTELIREWARGLEKLLTPENKQLLENRRK
jgi:hypothetical protein